MITWNVTLDEYDNAIMTRMTTPHILDEDVIYLDPWMLELEHSLLSDGWPGSENLGTSTGMPRLRFCRPTPRAWAS